MKTILSHFTIGVVLLVAACSNELEKLPKAANLVEGRYYNQLGNSDTLFFQTKKPHSAIRGRFSLAWEIKEDSIFREDNHGLLWYLKKDRSSYVIKKDLLILRYSSKSADTFKILEVDQKQFKLLQVGGSQEGVSDNRIRSDIQLR